MMKSKIHRATVTDADLHYVGSITIDRNLLEAADMLPNERVQVVNNNNGARFETYIFEGEPGSGRICLNGAAARQVHPGDIIIIISYGWMDGAEVRQHQPKVVHVDGHNRITSVESGERDPESC